MLARQRRWALRSPQNPHEKQLFAALLPRPETPEKQRRLLLPTGEETGGGSATMRCIEALRTCASDLRRSRLPGNKNGRLTRPRLRLGGFECGLPPGVLRFLALLNGGRLLFGRGHLHVIGLLCG